MFIIDLLLILFLCPVPGTDISIMLPKMEKNEVEKTLMKWLNVLGIWLMAIPEFVVILYAIGHINAFLSRNSGSCGVGCLGDLVVFLRCIFWQYF